MMPIIVNTAVKLCVMIEVKQMIAVKGLKMPKKCAACPFYFDDNEYVFSVCLMLEKYVDGEAKKRDKECPLRVVRAVEQ